MILEEKKLADFITANIINCTKEVLTSEEVARYMGISKSYLYKLTMRKQILIAAEWMYHPYHFEMYQS